jgi:hypothetical protein
MIPVRTPPLQPHKPQLHRHVGARADAHEAAAAAHKRLDARSAEGTKRVERGLRIAARHNEYVELWQQKAPRGDV